MTKPLYFDARYIRVGHHDGISRFSAGLFAALAKKTEVIAIVSDLRQLEKLPLNTKYVELSEPTNPIAEMFLARKLNHLGAEIVYSPMQTMGKWFRKYKLVLTLHDLIYYSHPSPPPSFSRLIRIGWRLFHLSYAPQRWILSGADAVATVSNTTKNLILKHNLTHKPVFVVYNAAKNNANVSKVTREKSLVYMGSFMDYKNVECLIVAMNLLSDYRLHLLSKISDERKAQLQKLAGEVESRVEFHNGVTDEEYVSLLSEATALVSASRDEGFGIPVIEAMQLGTPAVISDIEIFREIGGEAARYFDPEQPTQLADRIRELEAPGQWTIASEQSVSQARKFSWENSADALLEQIKRL
jgi:glycosyltransferase involved in cell wall biosynthesis